MTKTSSQFSYLRRWKKQIFHIFAWKKWLNQLIVAALKIGQIKILFALSCCCVLKLGNLVWKRCLHPIWMWTPLKLRDNTLTSWFHVTQRKNASLFVFFFSTDSSSVIQQRAEVNWCWLVSTFLCGPVITQPLSSVSVSGAFLLNNLIRMTQIAVRGRLTNARIFQCHSLSLMEKHYLPDVSCLFFLHLRVDLSCCSGYVNKATKRQ